MQLYCSPPATPPEGVTMAIVKVHTHRKHLDTLVMKSAWFYMYSGTSSSYMYMYTYISLLHNNYCSQIFIGQYLEFTLNDTLNYGLTDTSTHLDLGVILVISITIPLLLLIIVISYVTLLCVVLVCKKSRIKRTHDQPRWINYHNNVILAVASF